jgi:superoxide dismutase
MACCPVCACRPDYMTTFVDKLIDWDNVAKRFAAATN